MEWRIWEGGAGGFAYVDGEAYPVQLLPGEVRVRLPFPVDWARLRQVLAEAGFAVGPDLEEVERTGSQGWGEGYDVDGYYPYFVRDDPQRPGESVFTFSPRDYATGQGLQGQGAAMAHTPQLGAGTMAELERWVPYLCAARRLPRGTGQHHGPLLPDWQAAEPLHPVGETGEDPLV